MTTLKKVILFFTCICIANNLQAQSQNISTKIIKSIGFAEVHHVIPNADGYFLIGSKGNDVMHKKLWLIQLNNKMQITSSEVLHNMDITTPIQYTNMPNGQLVILAQEKLNDDMAERSVLLTVNTKHQIVNTTVCNNTDSTNYTCITNYNNTIVLGGVTHHEPKFALEQDALALACLTDKGYVLWTKNYGLANSQLKINEIIIDKQNNIVCSGSGINLMKNNEELFFEPTNNNTKRKPIDEEEVDTKAVTIIDNHYWITAKFSATGEFAKSIAVAGYANYNQCGSMHHDENGYTAVLNNYKYFGAPVVVQLSNDLEIKNSNALQGTPVIVSALMDTKDQLVLGAIFTNDVNNYSPGFVSINKNDNTVQAKSSTLLFDFFMLNTLQKTNNGFTIAGNGYMHDQFSDVYIYPFDANGNGVCDYAAQDVMLEPIDLYAANLKANLVNNSAITFATIAAVTEKSEIQLSSVCNTADELVVPKDQNKNWEDWNKNNQEAFTYQVPAKWIRVYPNPTSGLVKIEYLAARNDVLQVSVYNQVGNIVQTKTITNQDVFEIDIAQLPAGKYYVKVNDGNAEMIETVVKE